MRTIVLAVLLSASSFTLHAQYTGGSSDGDDEDEILNKLFNGNTATATGLVFLTHPSNTTVWKNTVAAMLDVVSSNNLQFGGSTSITISLANNPGSATVGGTATLSSSGGRATFTGLYLDKSGTGYTLSASATGLNSATGNTFNVSAASLSMRSQPPSYTYANQPFGLSIAVVDANGTQLTLANPSLSLSIATNPGSSTLSGTTTVQASAGLATFSGLSLNNDGMGYVLQIANPDMNSLNTQAFDVFTNLTFLGGNSDGDDVGTYTATLPVSGQVFWVGGGGSSPTAWNDPLNWFPNTAVPDQNARIAMEPNNNGHNPILDQNRTVFSFNFNGANKKIVLGNFNLTPTGALDGANANNYVQTNGTGTLLRSIAAAGSFTYPVGNANYNPVTIVNNNSASDVFSVKVRDEVLVNGTSGGQVADPHVNATWDISKINANTGSGVDLVFQWENSQERNSIANFSLNRHNGTDWDFAVNSSNSVTGSTTKIMNHNGYTGTFSQFAIGDQNTPLPIKLLYFTAECNPQGSRILRWATASEINSDYFELQSSDDMLHWTNLKTIPALGFHSSTYQYPEVVDSKPSQTTKYYRLKQVDLDGEYTYFQTIAAHCPLSATSVSLYPNPTAEDLHIQGAQTGVSWEILDMTGRRIRTGTINDRPLQSISILGLPAGIYRLKLPTISFPFIIQ